MILPPLTRYILEKTPLNAFKIYGIDRLMCKSCDEWLQYAESPRSVHEHWAFTHLNLFSVGSRLVQYGEYMDEGVPDGWVPIGFFQMWFPSATDTHTYPGEHSAADRTDVLHAKRYKREDRELIPEIVAIHLESEEAVMGANWSGRQTVRFGHTKEAASPTAMAIDSVLQRVRRWWYWLVLWLRKLFPPANHY
jgi:hypothetical protein